MKRIAVIGPESTGKSDLCEFLAKHYKTLWIPEYARTYLPQINRDYTLDDIIEIYRTQFEQETSLLKDANSVIFTDTEFIIGKVWCETVFGNCPPYFETMIKESPYDLYLLTAPDLPWVYDPLRENPGKGQYFFDWYKRILDENKLPYGIVKGTDDDRRQNALSIIRAMTGLSSENIQ